jgi:formiminotetrahydrofolate cyclodeaminase
VASPSRYLGLTLEEWLGELSAPTPAPAGGSALAYATACAAAVLVLAARVSEGSWEGAAGAAAQAELLRDRATPLAQRDAEAYAAALDARRSARALPPDRRDHALGQAFAGAAEPPLEIARIAADVAELAAQVAALGSQAVRADAVAAAALAAGAARGAVAMVEVNLTASTDDPRVAEAQRLADAAASALASIV